MTTESTGTPDPVLIYFKPGEYGALFSFMEKGNAETALFMLKDIATRQELSLFTVTHRHEYGTTTYITAGAQPPDPYAVVGGEWEGDHKNEEISVEGPLDVRRIGRTEAFSVPGELCPRCLHPMNSEDYTHPPEVEARDECPECQLCMDCCPARTTGDGEDADID